MGFALIRAYGGADKREADSLSLLTSVCKNYDFQHFGALHGK